MNIFTGTEQFDLWLDNNNVVFLAMPQEFDHLNLHTTFRYIASVEVPSAQLDIEQDRFVRLTQDAVNAALRTA